MVWHLRDMHHCCNSIETPQQFHILTGIQDCYGCLHWMRICENKNSYINLSKPVLLSLPDLQVVLSSLHEQGDITAIATPFPHQWGVF